MNIPRRSNRRFHWVCVCLFLCCVIQASPSPLISQLGLPDSVKLRIGRGSVHSVDYSPDGRRIAAASSVGIWIYDALYGGEIALLGGHESWANSAAYSPDGKRIVSADRDGMIRIWDAETGKALKTLKGHQHIVISAAYSPDGKRIVSASWDKTARIWDAETGALLKTLEGHTQTVASAAFSPDGKRIVSASWDKTARIWDAETGEPINTLKGHTEKVTWASYSPDGTIIASASAGDTTSADDTIRIWDAQTGKHIRTLSKRGIDGLAAAFLLDGKHIAGGDDSGLRLWNVAYGSPLQPFDTPHGASSIAFSPDGHFIAGGLSANRPSSDSFIGGFERHSGIRIWNIKLRALVRTFDGHASCSQYAAFSPDGKRLAVEFNGQFKILDVETGAFSSRFKEKVGGTVKKAAYSPDGKAIALLMESRREILKKIQILNAETGAPLKTFTGPSMAWRIAYSPDSKKIIIGSMDNNTVQIMGRRDRIVSQNAQRAYGVDLRGGVFAGRQADRQRKYGRNGSDLGRRHRRASQNARRA